MFGSIIYIILTQHTIHTMVGINWSNLTARLPHSLFSFSIRRWLSGQNKLYFIRLRGTKEGQECASLGHLEIFPMSSGERQRKSRVTLKEQRRNKRHSRGRAGANKMNNRGTDDVQQGYER